MMHVGEQSWAEKQGCGKKNCKVEERPRIDCEDSTRKILFLHNTSTLRASPRSLDRSAMPSPRRLGISYAVEINATL